MLDEEPVEARWPKGVEVLFDGGSLSAEGVTLRRVVEDVADAAKDEARRASKLVEVASLLGELRGPGLRFAREEDTGSEVDAVCLPALSAAVVVRVVDERDGAELQEAVELIA